MKTRIGFISNSSSSSFIIVNKSKDNKSYEDFLKENYELIIASSYRFEGSSAEVKKSINKLKKDVKSFSELHILAPGENNISVSDDGGNIFEAALRSALDTSKVEQCKCCGSEKRYCKWDESETFKWRIKYNSQASSEEYLLEE
jgi:hypothetical protein